MKHKNLKKLMFLMVLMLGVGQAAQAGIELTFDENNKAYIYPKNMIATGMTLDTETGILTKTEKGNANILIELGDVDFSNITNIEVNVDVTSEGYTDLFWRTIIRNQTEDINAWYTSKYDIEYTNYQAKSEHIKDILIETVNETTGTMKIENICITKSPFEKGEVNLQDIPYFEKNGDKWEDKTPDWNLNAPNGTIYGSGSGAPTHYADLSEYDELRIYTEDPVRLFFFNQKSDEFTDGMAEGDYRALVDQNSSPVRVIVGEEYCTVNLNAIKEAYGVVKLIGIKANYGNEATVTKLALFNYEPMVLNFDNGGKAYIDLNEIEVKGMTFDPQTGILEKATEGEASLTINFNGLDFSDVTNIKVDTTGSNSVDLLQYTHIYNTLQEDHVHEWIASKYEYNPDDNVRAKLGSAKSLTLYMNANTTGAMKINSICITKSSVVSAMNGGEKSLRDLPYYEHTGAQDIPFEDKEFTEIENVYWNMGVIAETFYGNCNGVQQQKSYADLNDYDELRVYMSDDGVTVRCWFIAATFNTENTGDNANIHTVYLDHNDEGKDYATVDLAEVKNTCGGRAYLIGMKTQGGTTIVKNVTVYDDADADANYALSGKGVLSTEAEAALADANATAIDATGLTNTEAITLESANPNCLFIVSDAAKLANAKNVLVKGEDGTYDCANLELTPGYPFHAPYDFTAAKAKTQKTVNKGGHSTLVLPYEAAMPDGCEAYTVTGVNEQNKLEGTAIQTIPANKPVLLENPGTYDFSADNVTVAATAAELTNGILTGVYDNSTKTPVGSYALQTQDGVQAFYHATSEEVAPTMTPFTAYLTDDASNQANVNRLIFDFEDNDVTGIEQVEAAAKAAATVVEIYDLSGRKVSAPVKGINLMKMSDGTVKKVIVK